MGESTTLDLFDGTVLDTRALHRMLYSEFNRFQAAFEAHEEHADQSLRGGALLWCATFATEAFPWSLVQEIHSLVTRSSRDDDFDTFGWYNLVPLLATLARVGSNDYWLMQAVANLSHHSSNMRWGVACDLALAAPCLPVDSKVFVDAVGRNFEIGHMFADQPLALYVASRGTKAAKTTQIARWCEEVSPTRQEREMLLSLRDNGFARNPFAPWIGQLNRYVALRMATAWTETPVQLSGILPSASPHPLAAAENPIAGRTVWHRLEQHPLAGAYVELADADE